MRIKYDDEYGFCAFGLGDIHVGDTVETRKDGNRVIAHIWENEFDEAYVSVTMDDGKLKTLEIFGLLSIVETTAIVEA